MHHGAFKNQTSDFSGAIEYYNKAIDICLADKDSLGLAEARLYIGRCLSFMGKYKEANEQYFETSELLSSLNPSEQKEDIQIRVSNNIGFVYFQLNQFKKSIDYFKTALQGNKKTHRIDGIAGSYNNLAACYLKLEDYGWARTYLDSCVLLAAKEKVNPQFKANALSNIGAILVYQGDTSAAIKETQKAIAIFDEIGSQYNQAISWNQIAAITKGEASISNAQKALGIAKSVQADKLQLEIYHLLYERYKEVGKNDSALLMLERQNELEKQINEAESLLQLSEHEKEQKIKSMELSLIHI